MYLRVVCNSQRALPIQFVTCFSLPLTQMLQPHGQELDVPEAPPHGSNRSSCSLQPCSYQYCLSLCKPQHVLQLLLLQVFLLCLSLLSLQQPHHEHFISFIVSQFFGILLFFFPLQKCLPTYSQSQRFFSHIQSMKKPIKSSLHKKTNYFNYTCL